MRFSGLAGLLLLFSVVVPTDHVDVTRQNWNAAETILTSAVVQGAHFGRMGVYPADAAVYAQPLYLPGLAIAGATHDVLIVATMNNTVYAYDADLPAAPAFWSTNFGAPNTTYPTHSQIGNTLLWGGPLGCLVTPAADLVAGELYTLCATSSGGWVLRVLTLATGAIARSVTVTGQFPGTGDPGGGDTVIGGQLQFNSPMELARIGLTLANNTVYLGFGSYGDDRPWHGWAFAYRMSDLSQTGVFCTSPSEFGAGIWGSGGGFSVDGAGNLYALTGNGVFNLSDGTYGEAILKFSSTLLLLDYFVPSNWATLNANDSDLSSGRAILVPGTTLMVAGAKDYRVYSIDTTCMGHLQGSTPTCTGIAAQLWFTNPGGVISNHSGVYGGIFFNGAAYFPNVGGSIYGFTISGNTWNQTPFVVSGTYQFPGATMTASSNGAANGLIWATTAATDSTFSPAAGTLRVLDPSTLTELWNSDTSGHDTLGVLSKFAAPTVANGRVYVATNDSGVKVFGVQTTANLRGSASLHGSATLR